MMEKLGWSGTEWARKIEGQGYDMEGEVERRMKDINK